MATTQPDLSHRDATHPSRQRTIAITALFLCVVVSVVPWRSDTLYSGGADVVVIGKAAVALLGLAGAVLLLTRTRTFVAIGLGPAGLLAIVLLVSLLGATTAGNQSSTLVLVARVFIVMATVLILLSAAPWRQALGALLTAMAIVATVATISGLPSFASQGRLYGGIPEIHPNELAGLATLPLVAVVVGMLRGGVRLGNAVAAIWLLMIIVATGSRTALLVLVLALIVAVLTNGIRDRSIVILLLVMLPVLYAAVFFTGVVDALSTRGGTTDTTSSLDSRFDAWRVVLAWDWATWEKWIGLGLSVKEVKVEIQWRDTQVLDSSWVSLLAHAGVIGVALVAGLLAWAVVAALVSAKRRGLILPLLLLVVFRSLTESGLVDSAMPFVMMLTLCTLLTHRSRHADDLPRSHWYQRQTHSTQLLRVP